MVDIPGNVLKPRRIVGTMMTIEDNMKLSEIIVAVANANIALDDVYLDCDWGYQDEPETWTVQYYRMETPTETQARINLWVADYNAKMDVINAAAEKDRAQRNDKDWKEFQRLKKKFGTQ